MTPRRLLAFGGLLAALLAVPLGLVAWNEYELASGERVRLLAAPVDPEDPFRGQYVTLTYGISRLDVGAARPGTTVYVPLRRAGDVWTGTEVEREPPDDGVFIRGRVAGAGIRYGIETFYVEEGEGPRYEQAMAQRRLYADVVVDDNGEARLDDLDIGPPRN